MAITTTEITNTNAKRAAYIFFLIKVNAKRVTVIPKKADLENEIATSPNIKSEAGIAKYNEPGEIRRTLRIMPAKSPR